MSDREEFVHRLREVSLAIDQVLIAGHAMAHDLERVLEKRGETMPPFHTKQGDLTESEKLETANVVALKQFGPGALWNLWCIVRALDALRVAWTGAPTPPRASEVASAGSTGQPGSKPTEAPKAAPGPLQANAGLPE